MPQLPNLPGGPRRQPIFFDYPRVDTAVITVRSPEGFEPADAPQSRVVEDWFGRYTLDFRRTTNGFNIERAMVLRPLWLDVEDYPALRKFVDDVRKSDRTVVQFRRRSRNEVE